MSGAWIGGEDRSINSHVLGSGAVIPIWGFYMDKVYSDTALNYSKSIDFKPPENFNLNLNCLKGRGMTKDPFSSNDDGLKFD